MRLLSNRTIHPHKSPKFCLRGALLRAGLISVLCLVLPEVLHGQSTLVSISLEDTTVEAIINEIRNQTELDFIYNHEELEKCPKVTISISEGTAEEVLTHCLNNSGLSYKKVSNTIIITPVKEEEKRNPVQPEIITQTLRGKVRDSESKAPLPYANVAILNIYPPKGATTDDNGNFRIENIPIGRYTIQVSYVGYEDAIFPEILIGSAKEVVLSVEITEKSESIGEVSVTVKKGEPLNQMAGVSARSFRVEETDRYAASFSDPGRMAQVFAGVAVGEDSKNEIIIRGNSPNWMLWRLEGVEIPSPNHFAEEGYTSGAVSILSSNMIGVSDFYTGAFPAEYGNALSGVFDIRLREGNNQENEYRFQAGVLGIDLSAEGPFKKGYEGSYLLNYRYSTFTLMNNLNIYISENALPNYQDLSFKINLPGKKAGVFSLWAIGGLSDDDEKYLPDPTTGGNLANGYRDFTSAGMYATGLSHTYFPDDKSYIKTVVSHSLSFSSENYEQMDSLGNLHVNLHDNLQNMALRVNTFYNRKISSKLTLRLGGSWNHLNYDFFSELADADRTLSTFLNSSGKTNLYHGYVQSKYKFSDRILFTAGLHYAHFALSRDNSIEPRLGLSVKLPKRQKLSFGYSHHSKNENLPVYFVEHENPDGTLFLPHTSLKMTRSIHYILAYDKQLDDDFNIKTEAYYQSISNLPVPNNPSKLWTPAFGGLYPDDTLTNDGKGRNFGVEITLQKFFTNNYYFLVTSSIFDSKYMPAGGKWYNSRYNLNYVSNVVGGKEFKWGENKMIGINSKIMWTGGKRILSVDLPASIAKGEAVYLTNALYNYKVSDYFRIDLGIKFHLFKKRLEHVFSIDIQNATNRKNVWTEVYNAEKESIEEYPMAGIIPIFNYRIDF